MQLLELSALGIFAVAIVFAVANFRFLLYPLLPMLNPIATATSLALEGNTFFISDLHLSADNPFPYTQNLHSVLRQHQVSNLVVVGDLFDSPEDAEILEADRTVSIPTILGINDLPIALFFVHGSPGHDPPSDQHLSAFQFRLLGNCSIISFDGFKVVAYHGHDLSRKGMFGHGWDRFISRLSLERLWKRFAGVPKEDWVVFGHLHIPGVDIKRRVANCGGWQTVKILVDPACTGLFLSPGGAGPEIVKVAEQGE